MGHSHSHSHEDYENHSDASGLKMAFWLNFIFSLIEFIGGILTNSMAILSDALHDLGDAFVILLSWRLEKFSQKKPDLRYTYGYQRFSLLGALITGLVLAVGAALIIRESIPRLFSTPEVHTSGMLALAILGLSVNLAAMLRLRHGGGLNQRMVMLHLLEDTIGWIAVLLGAVAIWLWGYGWIDPLLSIAINIFILYRVYGNLKETLDILMQRSPEGLNRDVLENEILSIRGVKALHALHLWSLNGQEHILSVHIVVSPNLNNAGKADLKRTIKSLLLRYRVKNATIEFETEEETCDCR